MRDVDIIIIWLVFSLAGHIDQLQDQRSSGNNAAPPWKKISPNNVLQDGGFPGRLRANYNLYTSQSKFAYTVLPQLAGGGVGYDLG